MKDYSKVSKFGIIISLVAVILSAIEILYSVIKGIPVRKSSIVLFFCMLTTFFANITVAQSNKKQKNNA